jgi:hypothetical protein
MAWDVRRTYYYLVCFATLLMMIIGSVQLVQNTLDLIFPEEHYRMTPMDVYDRYQRPGGNAATETPYTQEELEQMIEEEAERNERQARRRALRNLLGNIALIVIAAPVYVYHWRKVRAVEQGSPES